MLEFIGGGSRSTTPHSLISRKSPSNDMGVQAGSGGNNNQSRDSNRDGGKRNNSQSSGGNQREQRNRRDSGRNQDENNKRDQNQASQGQRNQHHNSNGQFNNKYQRNPQQSMQGQGMQHQGQGQQQNRMGGNGGGWIQRGGGAGGPGGMQNQMRGQRGGRMNTRTMNNPVSVCASVLGVRNELLIFSSPLLPAQQNFRQINPNLKPRVPGKPIKFESDYDFEQANSKFEELFAKLKVGDGSANPEDKNEQQVADIFLCLFC